MYVCLHYILEYIITLLSLFLAFLSILTIYYLLRVLCFDLAFSFLHPIDFSLSFNYFRSSGFLKMGALRAGSSAWSGWLGLLPWVSPVPGWDGSLGFMCAV